MAEAIGEKGADDVLGGKGHHGTLYEEVPLCFAWAEKPGFRDGRYDCTESTAGGHGRVEMRRVWCTSEIQECAEREIWRGVCRCARGESAWSVRDHLQRERRYYLRSLSGEDAEEFARAVRTPWSMENSLHWVLDVAFREADSRRRTEHGAETFTILRRMALSLLKQERSTKVGIHTKRLKAGWDDGYLLKVLGF